ncbi:MAG: integral rane sensor hybrid histidine kinase [Herminiimonas sp.]|nr:integral rane sensor hybrid histidine kinase [Herminiimonas sp.]
MKVRAYLMMMAVAILVPAIGFSAVALSMVLRAEREAALRSVQETARATTLMIDRELENAENALRILATSRSLAAGDLKSFYQEATVASGNEGAWTVLYARDGQQLVNTRLPFGTKLPRRAHPEYGLKVMQTQTRHVSNLMKGTVAGQYVVSIDAPVALDGGQRYILGQGFVTEHFNRMFAQRRRPSSWIIGISDREGVTIARSYNAAEMVGKPVAPEVVQAARAANEGVLQNTSRDKADIYTVFTHSAVSGWTIAVGVPVKEIEWTARRAVLVAALGLLAAILFAASVTMILGRRLVRSIIRAEQAAAALGRGEVPALTRSHVTEIDKVHAALKKAGEIIMRERESRTLAEKERASLFVSEQEARRLAEQQNDAKDKFLAMLGHELRNPLSAISGAVDVMEAAGTRTEMVDRAQMILRRQTRHLIHIVDDLLDVSRAMTGKTILDRRQVDLGKAVKSCADTLRTAGRAGHHILNLVTESALVDADPIRLDQIINNLLINAIKYTPDGGQVDVQVHVERDQAVLVVRDSGIGIAADLLPIVFDAFVQGATSIDRAQGGLGIGLTLVRKLTELHGGTVEAASGGPGRGSTFTVRLPLSNGQAISPPQATTASRGTSDVLLIEDNDDGRLMMSTMLTMYGYRVLEAGNGTDGLRIAAAEKPDIAVVDIGLPGLDGYEIARRLRADPGTHGIRLIAVTGYGQEADRERALDAGFDMHLVKPVDVDRLMEIIEMYARDSGRNA